MINQPQTIIHAKAEQQVPEALFAMGLRKCPTVFGYAIRDISDEDGTVSLQTDNFTKTGTVEEMVRLDTEAKKYEAIYYLANVPGKFTKDDVQPYVLTIFTDEEDKIGKDILAFFLEGDFPQYAKADSGHTDEYNFAQEIIIPTLQDMFLAAGQDIATFTASLHKPLFEKNLMAHIGHRAAFLFLPLEGDVVKFGKNELGAGWDWGTCSQHLEFDRVTKPITNAAATVVEKAKKFNPFGKKGAEATKVDDKGIHHINTEQANDIPVKTPTTDSMLGKHLVKPPAGLDKSARNRWLRLFNHGDLPEKHDHRDFPGLWITSDVLPYAQKQNITTVAQVDALGAEMRTGVKKQPVVPTKVNSPSDFLPTMTDAEMTEQTGILAKFVDRTKVPTALEIQKIESQWPTYSEKMGIPFEDMFRWTVAEIMEVCKGHKPSVMVILEMRRRLIEKTDVKDLVGTAAKETAKHIEAKTILGPDGQPAKTTVASKRNLLFGSKKTA